MATRAKTAEESRDGLDHTLRREVEAARARVSQLTAHRRELERHLRSAREAERAAIDSLGSLEAVAIQVGAIREDPTVATSWTPLAGAELRDMIARVGLRQATIGEPVHWRVWLGWLRDDGFDAAGKNAEATFQTQLTRSPLVCRAEREGTYRLDLGQFDRNRDQLTELHHRLAQLPPPDQLALLGDVRTQRQELQLEISRVERGLHEIWRVLAKEPPRGLAGGPDVAPEHVIEAWMAAYSASPERSSDGLRAHPN